MSQTAGNYFLLSGIFLTLHLHYHLTSSLLMTATFFTEKVAADSAQSFSPPERVWPCLNILDRHWIQSPLRKKSLSCLCSHTQLVWLISVDAHSVCISRDKCQNLTTSPLLYLTNRYLDPSYFLLTHIPQVRSLPWVFLSLTWGWYSTALVLLHGWPQNRLKFLHASVTFQFGWGTVTFSSIFRKLSSWCSQPIWLSNKNFTFNFSVSQSIFWGL